MVNSPPTPPPTTATELQDQLRSQPQSQPQVSAPNLPPPPSSPSQDCLPTIFPLIVDLAAKGQYHELLLKAEETDVLVRK